MSRPVERALRRRFAQPGRAARPARSARAGLAPRAALALVGVIALAANGCVPARGGWDGDAFVRARPELAALDGQRLADMVPVPALAPAALGEAPLRVALVACRFESGAVVRVRAGGPGWDEAVGGTVIEAFARAAEGFGLRLTRVDAGPAELEIEAHVGEGEAAPTGLGDTLVECDVDARGSRVAAEAEGSQRAGASGSAETAPAVWGRVRRAEIRMRRSGIDAAGRLQTASDEAWAGALLHELAHALGFAGHAARGSSLVVRDEHVLRQLGRQVLAGRALSDPTLAALYRLRPGEPLGERELGEANAGILRALAALDRERVAAGQARVAIVASVGDREAHWSIRYADGRRLGLRFPGWPMRLRAGRPIFVWPDRETLAALEAARARAAGRASESGGVDPRGARSALE